MAKPKLLSELEQTVLRDVVELHENQGHVLICSKVKPEELDAVGQLVLKGMLEIRATAKDQGFEERRVVPTPVGRRLIAKANTEDAFAGISEVMESA